MLFEIFGMQAYHVLLSFQICMLMIQLWNAYIHRTLAELLYKSELVFLDC